MIASSSPGKPTLSHGVAQRTTQSPFARTYRNGTLETRPKSSAGILHRLFGTCLCVQSMEVDTHLTSFFQSAAPRSRRSAPRVQSFEPRAGREAVELNSPRPKNGLHFPVLAILGGWRALCWMTPELKINGNSLRAFVDSGVDFAVFTQAFEKMMIDVRLRGDYPR